MMNKDSGEKLSANDVYAYHSMAFDIVEDLLKYVDKPKEIRNYISSFLRELTGANIAVIHEINLDSQLEISYVNPPRKVESVKSEEIQKLAELIYKRKKGGNWRHYDEDAEAGPILTSLNPGPSMGFSLLYGETFIGSILLLNIMTEERTALAFGAINLIAPIIALAFKNSLQFEMQEKIIDERTRGIKENQKRLRTLINNLPGLVYRSPIDKFLLREFVSENCDELFGQENKQIALSNNYSMEEIISREDIENIIETVKNALENDTDIELVYRISAKDGTEKWIWDKASIVYSDAHIPLAFDGFLTDITERKLAEETIRESDERFRKIFEESPIGKATFGADYRFLKFNPAFCRMLGYTEKELADLTDKEITHPAHLKEYEENVQAVLDGKLSLYQTEKRYITKSRNIIWVSITISPMYSARKEFLYLLAIIEDITERKLAEELLIKNEFRFNQIAECTGIWVWEVDTEGVYTYVSQMEESILGYTPDEIVGKMHFYDLFIPEIRAELKAKAFEVFSQKGNFVNLENANLHKDGHTVILETTGIPILDANGNLVGYRGADRDITERKRAEAELEKYRYHLEELVESRTEEIDAINRELINEIEKKNEAESLLKQSLEKEKELSILKSRFLSTASHEFRTPLTVMLSSVELVQRNYKKWDESKIESHLERVTNSIGHLTKMLDDVLMINRSEAGRTIFNPEMINLFKLCSSIINELQESIDKHHQILLTYNSPIHEIKFDRKQIELILNNMLSNSIKYSPNGGKVELIVNSDEKEIQIIISDQGIGIPEEDLPRLYDPFHRASNTADFQGTGFGLSIVKNAVEMHNGKINVTSKVGVGTTFTISIPLRK